MGLKIQRQVFAPTSCSDVSDSARLKVHLRTIISGSRGTHHWVFPWPICRNHCITILKTPPRHQYYILRKKERQRTLMLLPVWIMLLLHLQVCLTLYVTPKCASHELEDPWRLIPPFEGEHLNGCRQAGQPPQGQAPRFPYEWLNKSSFPKYPHYDGVNHRW